MNTKKSIFEDEQQLARAIRKGDKNAFEFIYSRYYKRLCLYANKFVKDLSLAEDIVQDCIYTLWDQRAKLEHITKIQSYLFRAIHNKCINHINHLMVQGKFKSEAAYKLRRIELEHKDSLLMQELEDKINHAIKTLPKKCRICFQLKRIEGYSQKEIAIKLDISEKAVEANITRALKQLRITLKDYLLILGFMGYLFLV